MAPENELICPPRKFWDNVIKPNHPDDFVDTPEDPHLVDFYGKCR